MKCIDDNGTCGLGGFCRQCHNLKGENMIGAGVVNSVVVHFTNAHHIKYKDCKFTVDKKTLRINMASGYADFQLSNIAGYAITYGSSKD